MINRVIWIILDSVGMGELPDAAKFGDVGSHTIGNIAKEYGLDIPNMRKLGLANIEGMINLEQVKQPKGVYGRVAELSNGKDTTIGHWEMVGIYSPVAFPTYPDGFPSEITDQFEAFVGKKILANKPASGTAIIEELGKEHMETGRPIVYTSADSVFQIAAHEDIISIEKLYEMCRQARDMLTGEHAVARVIARPFKGEPGSFYRTANRRDFSLTPPEATVLDNMKAHGLDVIGVGKIEDIFSGKGITEAIHTKDNMDGVDGTIAYMKKDNKGLIFTNLVEFDSKWGHRNDVEGYAKGLEAFDARLPEIIENMKDTDILIINADHGCDPTMPGSDHSREYVPLLAYGKPLKENVDLKTRKTFADIGQTISDIFNLEALKIGESFLKEMKK
ncbi:phosphopentomutase [Vallitalea pronyensis]|uniref:Phosphopentomutase n=1 Tax=Vallitalea pronyensis TaxID=1348613 RepID=A0A8J8MKF6_9FIRM|nr:phosphopentomutase [Vallitalea pronyensis]QUI23077.1 phosphopentomutase [Vallitalea pronyensis]